MSRKPQASDWHQGSVTEGITTLWPAEMLCPRGDLNTETREISLDRGDSLNEGNTDRSERPVIHRRVRCPAGGAQVSALTYCTTMTTCPSGLSVTVYQMVKPSEGRWRR
jgi:hypothetical protein